MSRYAPAVNIVDRPVAIDDEGRQLAPGEWSGRVRHQTQLIRDAVDRDELAVYPSLEDRDELSDGARAAVREAAELNASDSEPDVDNEKTEPAKTTGRRES